MSRPDVGKVPTRLGRVRRCCGFDRSDLRRKVDRVQWRIGLALLMAFAVIAPALAIWLASWSYASGMRVERREVATRYEVVATVGGPGGLGTAGLDRYLHQTVQATWKAPDGTPRVGMIPAWKNVKVGAQQRIWVDPSGKLTVRPRPHSRTVVDAGYAATGAVLAAAIPPLTAYLLLRRRFDRRRDAMWDEEWARIDPHRIS